MVASHISRRRILRDGIALGALGLAGFPTASVFAAPAATPKLPARGNMVIRNAYVMTMEPGAPDIPDGDVHVSAARSWPSARSVNAAGAKVINGARNDRAAGTGRDALAHVEHAASQHGGRKARARLLPHHRGARAEIPAQRHVSGHTARRCRGDQPGITTVHDWCHNIRWPGLRRGGSAGAARIGDPRALLLRRGAGQCRTTRASTPPTWSGWHATGRTGSTTA